MTGFARLTHQAEGLELEVEVRSVNHRFLELALKVPRCYALYERDIKAAFQRQHRRGRIDLYVMRRLHQPAEATIPERGENFDLLVRQYLSACKSFGVGSEGLSNFIAQLLLREQSSIDDGLPAGEVELSQLLQLLERASDSLAEMREREGAGLTADISKRVARIDLIRGQVASAAEKAPQRLKQLLESRIQELSPEVRGDPQRLALEVALLADKIDVSEELARLEVHLAQFTSTLCGHTDPVGRKLDFLVQEIGRELNTIGSKAQDARIQGMVVDAKAELERVREQVQNVE
jgi:uncharacterized protein (TIGR00255 family)